MAAILSLFDVMFSVSNWVGLSVIVDISSSANSMCRWGKYHSLISDSSLRQFQLLVTSLAHYPRLHPSMRSSLAYRRYSSVPVVVI